MALPIKETPVLTGKDADEFRKRMENPGSVLKEDYERAKKVHDEIEERRIKEAFNAMLKCNLKPETIICSICGNVYSIKDKKTSLCVHFKEMFKDFFTEISQF